MNKGGVISIDYCPTISTSSFQHNCFLIVYEKKDNSEVRHGLADGVSNTITGVQKDNWILCATTQ